MEVIFSDHANLKIEQRKLSRYKVLATISRSDFRKPSYGGREEIFKRFGKNHLKVVVVHESDIVIVVTAHWIAKTRKS